MLINLLKSFHFMTIEMIVSDADGCIVIEDKTKPPLLVSNEPNLPYLDKIKEFLAEHPALHFSVCTNRSLATGLPIITLAGISDICAFEGGNIIYNPKTGEAKLLVSLEKGLEKCRESLTELQKWRRGVSETELIKKLEINSENIREVSDRRAMFTFELLPYENAPITGQQLWKVIEKDYLTREMKKLIDEGSIKVNLSRAAVDISVNITKSDSTRYILNHYEIRKEKVLGIGDSFHSDMKIMNECGFYACPENSSPELREFIIRQKEKGYISDKKIGEGVWDILNHFAEQKEIN